MKLEGNFLGKEIKFRIFYYYFEVVWKWFNLVYVFWRVRCVFFVVYVVDGEFDYLKKVLG